MAKAVLMRRSRLASAIVASAFLRLSLSRLPKLRRAIGGWLCLLGTALAVALSRGVVGSRRYLCDKAALAVRHSFSYTVSYATSGRSESCNCAYNFICSKRKFFHDDNTPTGMRNWRQEMERERFPDRAALIPFLSKQVASPQLRPLTTPTPDRRLCLSPAVLQACGQSR